MFVDAPEGVSELMHHDALVLFVCGVVPQPPKIHRRLILWEVIRDQAVRADCRPRTRIRLKRNANFRVRVSYETEGNIHVVTPNVGLVFHFSLLEVVSVQKAAPKGAAVVPLLEVDQCHPCDSHGIGCAKISKLLDRAQMLEQGCVCGRRDFESRRFLAYRCDVVGSCNSVCRRSRGLITAWNDAVKTDVWR